MAAVTQAPVRLFDRRKTRESARLNGYRRPVAVNGFGASLTTAALVDRFGRKLDQAESRSQLLEMSRRSSNGHHDPVMETTDEGTIDEPVAVAGHVRQGAATNELPKSAT